MRSECYETNRLQNTVTDIIIGIITTSKGGSVAEWFACWTHAQKGPGSDRSRDAVG